MLYLLLKYYSIVKKLKISIYYTIYFSIFLKFLFRIKSNFYILNLDNYSGK